MKIVASSNAESLRAALAASTSLSAVVEAEYGGVEVEGSTDLLTLNHHIRSERMCPCLYRVEAFASTRDQVGLVGVSHFDLDTLGGLMALRGTKPESGYFWPMAAKVDLNGPHALSKEEKGWPSYTALAAFWAWSQNNRLVLPRDGSVIDITEFVERAEQTLLRILTGDKELLAAGKEFLDKEAALEAESFRTVQNGVLLRVGPGFVNHLYSHDDVVCDVVVGFNTTTGAITLSRRTDGVELDCCQTVQLVWGPAAGGHKGIAGSPRGVVFAEEDARNFWAKVVKICAWARV